MRRTVAAPMSSISSLSRVFRPPSMRSDSLQSIYTIYMLPIGANRIYQWRIGCDAGANRLPAKAAIRGRSEMIRRSFLLTAAAFSIAATAAQPAMAREQWSKEQPNTRYDKQPWLLDRQSKRLN